MRFRFALTAGFLASALAILTGCAATEEKTVVVKGKLMKGGAPFTSKEASGGKPLPPGDPGIRVRFAKAGGGTEYDVTVDGATGTFVVRGNAGKGVPPGHYKLTVHAGAFGADSAKGGSSGGPKSGPPKAGPPGAGGAPSIGAPDMQGKAIHTQEVDVPDAGLPDLVVDIKAK